VARNLSGLKYAKTMPAWVRGENYSQSQFLGDRSNQEDSVEFTLFGPDDANLLAVLSDGMGGHEAGEIASQIAINTFRNDFCSFNAKSLEGRLYASLQASNAELAREIAENKRLQGMGCTLVGVAVSNEGLSWVSVGDSPLYLFREGKLLRLNEDHSMLPVLEKLVIEGQITRQELASHPQRNSLRSALTGEKLGLIDTSPEPYPLLKDDIVICASDGLLTLGEGETTSILMSIRDQAAAEICDSLIAAVKAKARPKQDNVSIQVLRIHSHRGITSRGRKKIFFGIFLLAAFLIIVAGLQLLGARFGIPQQPDNQKEVIHPITPMPIEPSGLKEAPQGSRGQLPSGERNIPEKPASTVDKSGLRDRNDPEERGQEAKGMQRFETQERGGAKTPNSPEPTLVPALPSNPQSRSKANERQNEESSSSSNAMPGLPVSGGLSIPSSSPVGGSTKASGVSEEVEARKKDQK
jgi:PPM family protein phosphatase